MSINQKTEQHIDETLAKIRKIYVEVATRIEALQGDAKIPATKLAAEIAENYDMTGPSLYPTIKFLLDGYPDVKVSKGAHGGISKIQPKAEEVKVTP